MATTKTTDKQADSAPLQAGLPNPVQEAKAPAPAPPANKEPEKPTPEDKAALKFAEDNRTAEEEETDLKIKAREKTAELTAAPEGDGKINSPVKAKPQDMYFGKVIGHSTSSATGEVISFQMFFPRETTLEGAWDAFKTYQPTAVRETFKVDPDNTSDPNLRLASEVAGH